ncbi:membrane protein insertion efficiency factor YidD [Sphingomonas cavernae]|uniref:Putative membrane protein insertion efficiency factor n=1 Tax=Sphingomonas cavernae TaxID=2320861 RepID=A0A418WLL2_9SPHN|nr:membrane protein insertion efficiency factor YidD [Sphingomonas cavernae]RJF90936.1 membrane protein insertion efficiency factor YidD [Sphingomonas cavernae]
MIAKLLIGIARLWQIGPSAILPPSCRYQPSCSAYAITALSRYGALKGCWLSVRRIARCHPWGGSGYDPVP